MPLYEFYCYDHGRFEKRAKLGTKKSGCPKCKKRCSKVLSKFSFTMGSKTYNVPKSVDMQVGKAAEKAWSKYHERKNTRKKEKTRKTKKH
jgi:putative FmdB family regulatory protein